MSFVSLQFFSVYLQWAGSFIIFVSCLPLLKKRTAYIKILLYYSLASIGFQLAQQFSMVFFKNQGINQIGDGFVIAEAVLFGLLFWVVTEEKIFKRRVAIVLGAYILYYVISVSFFYSHAHSLIRMGRELVMILFSIGYFFYLLKKLPEENLLKFPMFWISAAIIFFFSGTFALSLMLDYIIQVMGNNLDGFWTFRNFFRFAFCLVLTYAVWLDWRLLKPKNHSV
jgi:hypothetical protein